MEKNGTKLQGRGKVVEKRGGGGWLVEKEVQWGRWWKKESGTALKDGSLIGRDRKVDVVSEWLHKKGLWVMGYGIWVMGYGSWVMSRRS